MKVWITKYALTKGVFEAEAEGSHTPKMITVRLPGHLPAYFHRGDWWLSKSDAIDYAEDMRDARIKSLEKQLAKLRKMEFKA